MAGKKKKPKVYNPVIVGAIIAASASLLVAIISLAKPFVDRMANKNTSTPMPVATSTPFSGRIPFTSPVDSNALNMDLQWDAGSSELSLYTLSANVIYLTAGPHTWPNFPTIYYMQPIEGNFDVQVKIKFTPPEPKLLAAQMVGLAIRPINARLVVENSSFPMDWVVVAKYITDAGSLVGCRGSWVKYSLGTVYLRIERDNNIWRCAYSDNGINWTRHDVSVDSQSLSDKQLEIALFAYSDTNDAITVEFSDWFITRK